MALTGAAIVVAVLAVVLIFNNFGGGYGKEIDALLVRNVAARGGDAAWRHLESVRLTGMMDLGQGLSVPYTIDQKQPRKMCLEYEFAERRQVQCVDGDAGWRYLPFQGRNVPEPMPQGDAEKLVDTTSVHGLLFDAYDRGLGIELLGKATVDGREANKLKVTMPSGMVRWLYLDEESGLELKMEAVQRVRGKDVVVETFFSNWRETAGLLFPHRQESGIAGVTDTRFVTVDRVDINPKIDDARFVMPSFAKPSV